MWWLKEKWECDSYFRNCLLLELGFTDFVGSKHQRETTKVKGNLENCQGFIPLRFLKRQEAIIDALKGVHAVKFKMEHSDNPLASTYDVYHSPRPPELVILPYFLLKSAAQTILWLCAGLIDGSYYFERHY